MNGQIPVETAVMGLAHGMNEEMLLSVTDEELMSQITDFYKEIGESAGSALGEAAVSSADQGVVSGIDALESKADDLVESLDIQDQQHTLETDNKDTAEAGMQAVGEGVENGTPDIQTAAEEAVEAVKSPFEDLPEATQAQALLMMQAIQAAIASGEPEATAAIAVAAQAVVTRAAQIMNEGEGQKIGKAFLDAIKKGVKAGQEALVTTSKTVAMAVKAAFDSILSTSAGSNIGAQICNGIVSGIQSGSSHIANAARNAARAALNAAQAALGIHSPSKAFEDVGSYMMQGMEIGLNDGRRDVTRTVSNIAHGIVDGLSDTPSVQLAADTLVTGLDGTVERLSDVAHMFQSIADSITAIGGLNVPAVASGAFTPYKVRVSDTGGLESTFTDMAHDLRRLASDRNEDSNDTRSLIRELIRVVQNLDLTVDGPSLERALTSLHRNRLQTYGY